MKVISTREYAAIIGEKLATVQRRIQRKNPYFENEDFPYLQKIKRLNRSFILELKQKYKMENPTKKAILKSTGKEVTVYWLKKGGWCDYSDCKTTYEESELRFI